MGMAALIVLLIVFVLVPVSPQTSSSPCGDLNCSHDQYCFRGTNTKCIGCDQSCDGCTGPGPMECVNCRAGFQLQSAACEGCPDGRFGVDCNGTCHCLDPLACNAATGRCIGKCEKGYYKPAQCQEECPDLLYGLDCKEECHCFNNSSCDKALGFCPGNLCHPDWVSYGCSKRLPKLSTPPLVSEATCAYLTVTWRVWDSEIDFGDLPVTEYRLYFRLNGSENATWTGAVTLKHNTSLAMYQYNVTQLLPDDYYVFRVDVHYSDDGKVEENTSEGLISSPTKVPCTTTTATPPLTVPVIIGTDIFNTMSASNQPDGSLFVTWSIDPDLRKFEWNITLSYQVIGTGDCAPYSGNITAIPVNQSSSNFSLSQPTKWTNYQILLTAQGRGIISAVNGSKTVTTISAEVPPSGIVSKLRVTEVQSTSVLLSWDSVPCDQRGGRLLHYDVFVQPVNSTAAQQLISTNVTSQLLENMAPYRGYQASVRYVNVAGAGPNSSDIFFTTAEGVPAAVTISGLVPTATSVEVNFNPPEPTNGVLTEYYILYSDTASFTLPQSLTFNASWAGAPVIRGLQPGTTYFIKVRGKTAAGYGEYGNAEMTSTLQTSPLPPTRLQQQMRNETCVSVSWDPPLPSSINLTAYMVTVTKQPSNQQRLTLPADATQHTVCDLQSGTIYNFSITSRSDDISGEAIWLEVTTEQGDLPSPPPPLLVNVSNTSAVIEIQPLSYSQGPLSAYQLRLQRMSSRRKRQTALPGYVTAELPASQVPDRRLFVIGDGQQYGNYVNYALESSLQYQVYYVVISTLGGVTKFNFSKMDGLINVPTAEQTSQTPVAAQVASDSGVLIGIILALIFVIIAIVIVIIVISWWRRRQKYPPKPPYFELNNERPVQAKESYDPEKYWNQITSLRESRYIVVGRECLPDSQLTPVGTESFQPLAAKVGFKTEFHSLPHKLDGATVLQAEQHPERNRFPHILPYDHSRVVLSPDSSSRCAYINASYLSGYQKQRCYIAAQSPYDDTTATDFWRLIHQHSIKTVVMIANVVEDNIVKCTQFWPEEGKARLGHLCLELEAEAEYADFRVLDVSVRESGEKYSHKVRLFEFTSWPDHGVPDDPIPFLDLRHKVRQYQADEPRPILVHCGTGVARTGVFVAVDSLIDQYAIEGRISVFSFVRKMRKERPHMVRTYKQYVFIYECLLEKFQAGYTMTDVVTIRARYHDWTSNTFLRDQFQLLQRLTRGPDSEQCVTALLPHNIKRNRYPEVVPSDRHRPQLRTPARLSNTDYINAIFVDGYRQQNQFIVTQTPLHTTLVDFWRLIYDHGVTTVVMMDCYKHEDDSCAEYWPTDVNKKQWEPFFVEITAAFQQENITIRNLKMVNTLRPQDPPHLVRQFQFNAWAEASLAPVSKSMALDMLDLVLEHHNTTHPNSPIVVHCEDGAKHSGLFVCLALLCERMNEEQEVDVYHVIKHIKRRRTRIISDYDQFRFCYKALWDYINLRMPGGTFTDSLGPTKLDKPYSVASLTLSSALDDLY